PLPNLPRKRGEGKMAVPRRDNRRVYSAPRAKAPCLTALMEPAAIEPAPVADLPKERRRRSDACSQRRTDVTHREKVAYLLTDLGQRGLHPQHVAPPWYRLLWRFGIEVRPPHFAGFWWVLAVHGGLCAMVAVGVTWTIHRWTGVYQHWSNVIID